VRQATPLMLASTLTDPNPRRMPEAADSSRISRASPAGMVKKCQLPFPSLHSQIGPVTVIMRDYVFNPTPLYLVPGETVTFSVINGGLLPHEFVLGDASVQDAWATANAAAGPAAPLATAAPASVPPGTGGIELVLDPGQQATVTYPVPAGQPLQLMCHLPGHVERGMVGSVILATP